MKKRATYLNHLSAAAMMRCLMDGPNNVHEISQETGVSLTTVRKYVAALRRAKVIRIAQWDADTYGRRSLASYVIGGGKDAPRPPTRTRELRAEIQRKRRARQRDPMRQLGAILSRVGAPA